MKRTVSAFMVTLILVSAFVSALIIQPVRTEPITIIVPDSYLTIQAAVNAATDGDTILVRDGTYTENVDVNKSLTIKSENGAEVTTIQTVTGDAFHVTANHVNISGFAIRGRYSGIYLDYVGHCQIYGNKLQGNYYGIATRTYWPSSNNTITDNFFENNERGLFISYGSGGNLITRNICRNSTMGIFLAGGNNIVTENTFDNNTFGVALYYSNGGNILSNNTISNNEYNFNVWGFDLGQFINTIDASNKVNGKPIYYLVNRQYEQVPIDAGYVAIVNSTNITVRSMTLSDNYDGVMLAYSTNSRVENVNAAQNYIGIRLHRSSNNTIIGNNVSYNSEGIYLYYNSPGIPSCINNTVSGNHVSNNEIGVDIATSGTNYVHHNNFIDNTQQVSIQHGQLYGFIVWDDGYPSGGNYWSDYTERYPDAEELDGSGIWNTPYIIDDKNQDNYPLVNPWTSPLNKFGIGDWVQTTANLNVREDPGLNYPIISTMPLGTIGQILGGPVEADGFVWWDVDYVVGVRGWSVEDWLELAPPNQPPVADFTFYPQQPKAGEDVTFNASSSYDPDGEVVFYEWDWDGDGDFDDYTLSPTITSWWLEEGSYDIRLRVIDDKGAINITSREVTISKTAFWWSEEAPSKASEATVDTASFWDLWEWFIYRSIPKDDKLAITKIDTWIRDGKGEPLDWFEPYREADLARLLREEVDPEQSPGLTFKAFARSKILEGDLMTRVAAFFRDQSAEMREEVMKPLFKYVYDSIWGIGIDISLEAIEELFPIVGVGLQSILFADSVRQLQDIVDAMNKEYFMRGLAWYLFRRGANDGPAEAWDYCLDPWVELAISTEEVPIAEGEDREDILVEIQAYYERLWGDYQVRLLHLGQWESYLQADKDQLRRLLLSEYRARFLAEGPDRRIVDIASPVELRVYDSEGLMTGVINGEIHVGIPYSVYNSETKTATMFFPSDFLEYDVVGTDVGTYDINVTCIENGQIINFTASDLPISPDAIHQYTINWAALSAGEEGVTLLVDSEGDGVVERIFSSDSELTSEEFIEKTSPTYPTFALTISAGENGTTFPPLGTYACAANSTIHVTALPNEGYALDYWELDSVNVGLTNPYTIHIDANHTVNAVFRLGLYDIAVTNVLPSKTIVGQGYRLTTNVTIANPGDFTETFNLTLYASATAVETIEIILAGGTATTITFMWNTTSFAYGNYTLWAYAEPVPSEANTADNSLIGGWVVVTLPGDTDGDRDVDIFDIVRMAGVYGTKPPNPKYNPNCDIDGDGDIDIFDLVRAAGNYGRSW